jgi:hypothetical protein
MPISLLKKYMQVKRYRSHSLHKNALPNNTRMMETVDCVNNVMKNENKEDKFSIFCLDTSYREEDVLNVTLTHLWLIM